MSRAELTVEVARDIESVDVEHWQRVVAGARAPVFYGLDYLRSYERYPVGSIDATRYLTVYRSGEPVAVFPCYLQPSPDPLGVFPASVPTAGSGLLGHVWYCYDTRIPMLPSGSELTEDIARAVLDRLARLRMEEGAVLGGLVNVDGRDPVLAVARRHGWSVLPVDSRHQLPLTGLDTFAGYLASLNRKARHNLARNLRRCADAGAVVSVAEPDRASLEEVCEICRLTASKFGNEEFYSPRRFPDFVLGLGARALVVRVDGPRELLGAAVLLIDDDRLHMWVAGFRYATVDGFSVHYVLWSTSIRIALERGVRLVEGGRRNGDFKVRYGMQPVALYACVTGGAASA
jgi:predicted N-acyltransferase